MTVPIVCPASIIPATLDVMRRGAERHSEALVLWLGRRRAGHIDLVEAYEPPYRSAVDYFHITPTGMLTVMEHLRQRRLFVCAQVHSHPGEAFHSAADDEWAIVRHAGALSLVVPQFAISTTPDNFLQKTAVFCLAPNDQWIEVPNYQLARHLEISDAHSTSGK